MDYDQAIHQLLSLPNSELGPQEREATRRFYNLDRIRSLMQRLGNPQDLIPTVHIAGTKGKGSTAAMITSVLTAAGYKVGLFTSPHIHEFRERIRIGLTPISKHTFGAYYEKVNHHIGQMESHTQNDIATVFETLVAMAFTVFHEEKVDFQVIETGLGGRLDATNIISAPVVSVITSLSLDHTKILGDSIEEIAHEKSGIIKPSIPVVCAPQQSQAMSVLEERCKETLSHMITPYKDHAIKVIDQSLAFQTFQILNGHDNPVYQTPLLGSHQIENAVVSLSAIDIIRERGLPISQEAKYRGLAEVDWPGRFQVLTTAPLVITDGAHNVDSAMRLRETIAEYISDYDITLVFGCGSDKDAQNIIKELSLIHPKTIIATRSRHPKAIPPEEIHKFFKPYSEECIEAISVNTAMATAIDATHTTKGAIVVTGSLFIASEAIEWATGTSPELYNMEQSVL